MRAIRAVYEIVVTLLGVLAVGIAVVADPSRPVVFKALVALLGVVLIRGATWTRSNPFLPDERRALELRTEVQALIESIRRLSRAGAQGGDADTRERTTRSIHSAVDRIERLTSPTDAGSGPS